MNFKTPLMAACLAAFSAPQLAADGPGKLPDIPGFRTLHCDFHIHTVFSDGKVWPDMRVLEAAREGLDCIAITDHFKYKLDSVRKKHPEITGDRNRAYENHRGRNQLPMHSLGDESTWFHVAPALEILHPLFPLLRSVYRSHGVDSR